MQSDFVIAHIAGNLRFRGEGCDRVDDDEIYCCRADEFVGDVECLLAAIRLRDQQFGDVDTEFLCIKTVEGVLGVDDSGDAA